jgi:hypothetical protein
MSETTELQVFHIPEANLPGLFDKIAKLSKKSVKLIGKPIALNVLGEVKKPHMVRVAARGIEPRENGYWQAIDADGNPCWDIWYNVTIDAETPKIAGWTFVATIDHSATAGNIIRSVPNTNCEIPETYRSVSPVCDHCGKIRSRRDTFLLRCDATGEFKQIGRQCIRDFIGYDVTRAVALAEISYSSSPSDSDRDYEGGIVLDRRYIFVRTYLAHVSACIRKLGWVSRKDAEMRDYTVQPTSSNAHHNMFPPPNSRDDRIALIDKDFETADAALEYGLSLASNPRGEYEYNLSIVCQETMIEGRSIGLLASLIPAFFRYTEREFQRTERRAALKLGESQHVGKEGDKIGTGKQHVIAPFEAVLYGYNAFDGRFGPTYLYRFRGDDGNVFVWFASEGPAETLGLGGLDASRRVRVRIVGGTVKKHSEREGVKQTQLTRTKVVVLGELPEGN